MSDAGFAEQRENLLQLIALDQEELRVAVHQLTVAAGVKLDIGERIKVSPLAWTIGAFLVGIWLGSDGASRDGERQRRRR